MISVIDYGSGNIQSVLNVLDDLKVEYLLTGREIDINKTEKIIIPGVGEASFAMKKFHLMNLSTMLRVCKKPVLGICLGMQLFCQKSEEGNVACLGIIPSTAKKFDDTTVKVPQMGWNQVEITKQSKLFEGIANNTQFYFANSYYVPVNEFTVASSNYGIDFTAALQKDNIYGVQFHPEKSGEAGISLIKNFIDLC